ncbi:MULTISPECIES: hypothetical protein [unclassified Rhodococcus (in: high G+C Gram-positive bacteria)]|uniref:hypothetical protein n=1 Tax=unclassified Rhodococcus (in: high G+C Gram-positive bacteria) TaxID=192944 RepID=UPI001FF76F05|nr:MULTISPECIES: hypothetical protein [unclassified Rhodococcus (in: high G+C Gram-positive bacteria)]
MVEATGGAVVVTGAASAVGTTTVVVTAAFGKGGVVASAVGFSTAVSWVPVSDGSPRRRATASR